MKKANHLMALLVFLPFSLSAQFMELGFFGGFSTYSGDLSPRNFGIYFEDAKPAGGVFARLNFSPHFAARLGYFSSRLEAYDARISRGLNFRTKINEINLSGEFSWWHFKLNRGKSEVFPFLMAGVAYFTMDPEGLYQGEWIALQPLGTEGQNLPGYDPPYSLSHLNVPIGVGIKFILNGSLTITLEFSGRKLFTDYLDDVSDTHLNYRELLRGSGPVTATMSNPAIDPEEDPDIDYRRGGSYNDWYYMPGISLGYVFGPRDDGIGNGARSKKQARCYQF